MAMVIVDGQEIEIGDEQKLNGIQVARLAGIEIPHYCWHPGLSVVASCRMCLVETGSRHPQTGQVVMVPKLTPACQTPAKDGTVFVTNSEPVRRARAMVEEDLLIDHPIDCPICDKAGECFLQDYHFQHGQSERRADIRPFTSRRRPLGDTVTLFVDRCVMCSRCVRFTREITGTSELMVIHRGSHEEIDVFPGYPLANKMSGNVVDLCPVGALADRKFLYRPRVWFMKSHPGVCTGCATGCSIHVDENQERIYRLRPRENPYVNQWWMCDEGRYGFDHVHSDQRVTRLRCQKRSARAGEGVYTDLEWSELPNRLGPELEKAGRLAAVLSPHLTIEEAYLLARYVRQLDGRAMLAMGPIPTVGHDERFASGFTIRAEKCPNRRGVEEIVRHFMGRTSAWEDLLAEIDAGAIRGVWVTSGSKIPWTVDTVAARFDKVGLLIAQDLFASPLWQRAHFQLPAASFAEREGSYVNHQDRLQSVAWAIRPPAGVQAEGRVFWRMLGRPGLYNARRVLDELAAEIPYFARAIAPIPANGLDLSGHPDQIHHDAGVSD
jgi:NADH-quinone oxidoreductase subunit G